MDMRLNTMVDAYNTFQEFDIFVSPEDQQEVESLRYNFDRMIKRVRKILYLTFYY